MGKRNEKKKKSGKGALFLASFVQVTAVPGSGFALLLLSGAPPSSSAPQGRAPASSVAVPGGRVLGAHCCRGTPGRSNPGSRESAGWSSITPRPRSTRSRTRLTSHPRVQGEGCRTRPVPAPLCTPRHARRIPAAGRIAELWGQAWPSGMQGHPACSTASSPPPTRGPATLTTPSHRRPSPPGTGSGTAPAPPRWSCSAPAGRTWASPATSSSGGSGARRWPSGAPACSRTLSSAPARPRQTGPRARRPRRCGGCDPRPLAAAAAPTSLGNLRDPAARLEAAPAAVPLQPLPGERTPTPHDTRSRSSARPGSCGRDPTGSGGGSLSSNSRENGSRRQHLSASGDLTQYGTCPRGGGSREERAGRADLARREPPLESRGRNSRGAGSRAPRVEAAAARAARASLWSHGRMPGAVAESHCDSVGEESQAIFELRATCSLEPAISKKHLQEQTGPVQKAVAFPSAQGRVLTPGC